MEHFDIIMLLILALLYGGNAELKIHIPKTFYAGEVISGRCVSNVNDCSEAPFVCITVTADDNCTVNRSKETETVGKHYQKNFTIICPSGNHTVSCYTIHKTKDKLLKVLKRPSSPEIINKPCNVTIAVGLPVTFRCYVKGDPNHYWVGWMSRNTIIQAGNDYSISTSQSFLSTNGTTHYLTIHEVKEAGKYDCKVYSLEGNVEDFITHEVMVSNDVAKPSSESSSSVNLLENLLNVN